MVSACSACPLKIDGSRRGYLPLLEYPGNFAGAVALNTKLEDQLDYWRSFLVNQKLSPLTFDISVGDNTAQPLWPMPKQGFLPPGRARP